MIDIPRACVELVLGIHVGIRTGGFGSRLDVSGRFQNFKDFSSNYFSGHHEHARA